MAIIVQLVQQLEILIPVQLEKEVKELVNKIKALVVNHVIQVSIAQLKGLYRLGFHHVMRDTFVMEAQKSLDHTKVLIV